MIPLTVLGPKLSYHVAAHNVPVHTRVEIAPCGCSIAGYRSNRHSYEPTWRDPYSQTHLSGKEFYIVITITPPGESSTVSSIAIICSYFRICLYSGTSK